MTEKVVLQHITEKAVDEHLKRMGHRILNSNLRWHTFEFDLISSFRSHLYVHEVRGTRSTNNPITDYFPPMKVLHLLKGIALYSPSAILYCYLVRVSNDGRMRIITVRGGDLL